MLTRQGKPEAAASTLEKLASEDEPSLAVELALADLYQGKLNQPDKALVHLRKAIALQDDADVRARIELLEKGQ